MTDAHNSTQTQNGSFQQRLGAPVSRSLVMRAGSVMLWLCIWQLASVVVGSNILLAGPFDTAVRLMQLLADPRFLSTVAFSLVRIVGGFLVAYVVAVILAFAAHRWPVIGQLFAPAIATLKSVPIACIIVLLLIWVGSRRVSGIAVFLAVFPAVYFSCAEGLANVDPSVTEMLEVFRVRGAVRLLAHVWPSALPYLVGTSKNVCGMAWKAGVAAELIGSPMGSIGERIYQSKILLETADLFAWTIVVVALSAVCERVFVAVLSRSDVMTRRLAMLLAKNPPRVDADDEQPVPSAVVLSDAVIGYGSDVVATGLSLNLCPGFRAVLTDASGMGKTTLLRTIAGLQPLIDGNALLLPPSSSLVFQESRLIESLSAVDNVQLVAGRLTQSKIRAALQELLPADALDVEVSKLSGGQRRRVEIARALLCPSTAVLLDEPFASLDADTHAAAAGFVRAHLHGRTLVVASHAVGDAALLGAEELTLFAQ